MKGLSLKVKFTIIFICLAFVTGAVNFYHAATLQNVQSIYSDLIQDDTARMEALQNMKIGAGDIYQLPFDARNTGQSPDALKTRLDEKRQQIDALLTDYRAHLEGEKSDANDRHTTQLQASAAALVAAGQAYVGSGTDQKSRQPQEAQLQAVYADFTALATTLLEQERSSITAEIAAAKTLVDSRISTANMFAGLAVVVSALVGLLMANLVGRALGHLRQGVERVANGDFTHPLTWKSHDEIGHLATAFNEMSLRLRDSYRRLALQKQRDEILLESMGEGLIALDEQDHIVLINSQAIRLLDLEEAHQLMGQPAADAFVLYDENERELAPLPKEERPGVKALNTMQPVSRTVAFKKKSGARLLLAVHANPVLVDNKLAGAIMVLRDVTKEKEVDRMKTEFISLASHQLRTPLSAIKWFTEMLLAGDAGKLSNEQQDFARNISDSTERMIELVNALLNISRLESGRIIIDPKPTNLKELVAGIVNDLKAKTVERNQTLLISVHDDLPKINLDPHLIGQVYLNLLTNAIKYTPKGGEISVFISRRGDQVISQVTDTGYGIPKEQHEKVFQKFFRAENIVKIETDGTGLGLYLIKSIVESSGGKIWFESEEGRGTTFWFSLPMSGMKAQKGEVSLDS